MAESYSVEAVLSATDKNFSKTMKGAVGSVDSMNSSISTMWYLSLSARSAASALADPFDLTVFCLRESA